MPDNLSPELLAVKSSMARFIDTHLSPAAAELNDSQVLESLANSVREASKAAGFYFKTQPKEFGGNPASTLELTLLREMLAAANTPLSKSVFGPGPGVLHAVEGGLKSDYLQPLLSGEKHAAFGFTEPNSAKRATYAVIDNDHLIINGQKSYITGGASADFVSILVNVEQADGRKMGTAMVVVDSNAKGATIDHHFTSLEGSQHVSMTFDKVRVSISQVIGNIGEGLPRALGAIGNVRMMVSAQAMGMCQWVLEYVEQYLKSPHRSGTPLGDKESIRLRFADMRIKAYVARSALYRTARLVDSGENTINETIATKVYCTETAGELVDMGVQLVGGQALVVGHPLEQLYRQVRSLRLVEGASDLLRLNLAKGKLELDKGRI